MFKKTILLGALLTTAAFAKISVFVTIFPLYDAAKNIAGDKADVVNLVPFGVEAHDFEPKAKDMALLSKSDLFITSGEGFEPWSKKVISSLNIKNKALDMSAKVKLIKPQSMGDEHGHNGHSHAAYDPHYWLNIDNQITIAKETAAAFSKKDPQNAKFYNDKASTYISKLTELKKEYETLKSCKNKKVIVNHNAFGYLSNEYGIKQYTISGMSPDAKPSSKQIARLIDVAKREKINTVFFEEFASDKVAKTIAKEANIKTDALRPIENITLDEGRKNIGYIDIMRSNLAKLKGAMDCK
ncbi:MAG: metal ABC transporter solute-binding protein, Zn/Mn family [Campylobacterales bacterium]